MIIAFEGPDNTGKTTDAAALHHTSTAPYNMAKDSHADALALHASTPGLVTAFDRIDWFTHMAYRLALPEKEWNDARVRTVFAAPDTHLVFKLHSPQTVPSKDSEEGYNDGDPARVNDMYFNLSQMFMSLNEAQGYSLFKTITLMEVISDPKDGSFSQRVIDFSSPASSWGSMSNKLVTDSASLLEMLQYEDQRIIARG